ncbi:zinc-binding dehydrogenase family protein [Ochrobactrum quorumnocens]|uniref:Zinc-binding dehydrogenase family protein n=1 Tax=Ochrobactrum quorumnocens TaxID=271865 RepID=A0A248UE98_9HYPH|nr:zinc-binding dehydrogenase [[Ochrobactrum] quorumnocens]ASV84942.1 zinc-binding dehydrogenase family protein [[Ochrobactrum] quorumnocens]
MRTIVSKGPRTELKIVEVEPPAAGVGEVVIDVRAIGVGRVDLIMREIISADFVPGIEVAGIVLAAGPDCDPQWLGRRVFSRTKAGAYADQVVVSSAVLVALPEGLSFEAAVASGVNALVAQFCLTKAQVIGGEHVLVRGAQGGIGHLAVQMAASLGAQLIDSPRGSSPAPTDVVIDLVAGSDTGAFIEQLNANGRYVIAGISAGMPPADFASSLLADFRRSRSLITLSLDTVPDAHLNSAAEKIFADVTAGNIKPVVAQTLTFEQADQAHHLIVEGGLHGKIVLVP